MIFEKVKTLCPCYDGLEVLALVKSWNDKGRHAGHWLEDGEMRYSIRVQCEEVKDIHKVWQRLDHMQGLEMMRAVVFTTEDRDPDQRHTMALSITYPEAPRMQALNSWASKDPVWDIDAGNFETAFIISPLIKQVKSSSGSEVV